MDDQTSNDPFAARWWAGVEQGELWYQRCAACDAAVFYPRIRCNRCFSDRLGWERSRGEGTIAAATIVHRAPGPAFADQVPYVVALVDLAEGFRMMTNIVDTAPEAATVGSPVRVEFRAGPDGRQLPYFCLAR